MARDTSNEDVGKRLREWGLSRYRSLGEFAKALSINQVHLSAYMAGRYRPGNKLQGKLRVIGMNIDWLMTGETPTIKQQTRGISLYPQYLVLDTPPSRKGNLLPTGSKYQEETIEFPMVGHFFLRASEEVGDAMSPEIQKGDLLLVDLQSEPEQGQLTVARWAKTYEVGHLEVSDNTRLLRFLNLTKPCAVLPKSAVLFRVALIKKEYRG